ncbi:hypothetical protein HYR99_14335 [Candidatus Poribacteria bacterium]|nr:hypothetical protein [Candidatus Poribacteria bacterium]
MMERILINLRLMSFPLLLNIPNIAQSPCQSTKKASQPSRDAERQHFAIVMQNGFQVWEIPTPIGLIKVDFA